MSPSVAAAGPRPGPRRRQGRCHHRVLRHVPADRQHALASTSSSRPRTSPRWPRQTKFIAALEPTIAAKHDALQAFADAIIDASRQFDTNPAPWIEAMGKARDDLTADNLTTATAKFLTGRWCVNGCMSTEKVGRTVDFLLDQGFCRGQETPAVADIIDQSFATKSIATSGAYAGASIDTTP